MTAPVSDRPIDTFIARWHDYVEARDPAGLDDLLHDDAVFRSPIVFTPQRGKAMTAAYLTAAMHVFPPLDDAEGGFTYVREVGDGLDAVLEFECTIDGKYVNGIDMIRFDEDGRILEFTVMIRPLQAINLIHGMMMSQLDALSDG